MFLEERLIITLTERSKSRDHDKMERWCSGEVQISVFQERCEWVEERRLVHSSLASFSL